MSKFEMDASIAPQPVPMEGHGAYNRSSSVQASGSSPAVPLLENAARLVDLDGCASPLVIADYGSSQGRNSFAPISAAIRCLRERVNSEHAISVIHTDLPNNDFSALFNALTTDERSYLLADSGTYASAIGRSFYTQILPSESVTLGWSSWAVQWLSRIPCPILDHVQVAYSRNEEARTAYAQQAADDWRTFLFQRQKELRSGGRLVVLTMALTEDGEYGYRPLLDAMYSSLQQLAEDGFLNRNELTSMAVPTVSRSLADLTAPFAEENLKGLGVEQAEVFVGCDAIWERYQSNGDAQAFGAQWAAFSRASVLPTLATALEGNDAKRITDFIDRVEAGMVERLAASPEKMVIPLGMVSIVKKDF